MVLHTIYPNSVPIRRMVKEWPFFNQCKGEISPTYLRQALESAHFVLLALGETDGAVQGFATMVLEPQAVRVTLLCSKSHEGKACMQQVVAFSRVIGAPNVHLDSLVRVAGFYKNIGFRKADKSKQAVPKGSTVKMSKKTRKKGKKHAAPARHEPRPPKRRKARDPRK